MGVLLLTLGEEDGTLQSGILALNLLSLDLTLTAREGPMTMFRL